MQKLNSQKGGYTAPDWPEGVYDYTSFTPTPIMVGAELDAWHAAQALRVSQAKKVSKKHEVHVEMPADGAWATDPFATISFPLGAFLEPEGFASIRRMKKPNTRSYKRHMPRTWALARTIYQALPEVAVWGRQRPGGGAAWETITAGKWVAGVSKGRTYKYEQKAMSEWDVLKMLANPEARALANADRSDDRFSRVRHVRIDIDMDDTFRFDGRNHLPELQGEIALVHDVFSAFGLTAYIFCTGNRGIQAVCGIPWTERSSAWVLTEMIRTVLRDSRVRDWRSTDFKSSLDGLMRLPLGLHKWSGSLALFLGRDGLILPVEQQADVFIDALVERPDDFSTDWAEEMRHRLGTAHEIPQITLQEIVAEFPRNPLVRTFLSACEQFDVRGYEKPQGPVIELRTHTTDVVNEKSNPPDLSATSELRTHTTGVVSKSSLKKARYAKNVSTWKSPRRLREIAQGILDAGFEPGESFLYYMNINGGKNAIGCALILKDGDLQAAEEMLVKQARNVGGSLNSVDDRIALIKRLIPKNDTYDHYQSRAYLPKHRSLAGDILESERVQSEAFMSALVKERRGSSQHIKEFKPSSLAAIGHIIELVQLAARESHDGFARISAGTLASEITCRWPDQEVAKSSVVKLLEWITTGYKNCLLEGLEIVEKPAKATDPTVYQIGQALWNFVPVEVE